MFLSIPITKKYQILSFDALVANERYFRPFTRGWKQMQFQKLCFLITNEIQKITHLMTQKCKCKKGKVHPRTGHEGQEWK
jgi:hypothetical protein